MATPPRPARSPRRRAARVVDLEPYRTARTAADPIRRLEAALLALAPLLRERDVTRRTETELLAALGQCTTGRFDAAAERLERLSKRLARSGGST